MKRLMLALLIFVLVACGGDAQAPATQVAASVQEVVAPTQAPAQVAAPVQEVVAPTQAPAQVAAPVQVVVEPQTYMFATPENPNGGFDVELKMGDLLPIGANVIVKESLYRSLCTGNWTAIAYASMEPRKVGDNSIVAGFSPTPLSGEVGFSYFNDGSFGSSRLKVGTCN